VTAPTRVRIPYVTRLHELAVSITRKAPRRPTKAERGQVEFGSFNASG
jgi:hypothetical protein